MSGGPDPFIVAARFCALLLGLGLFGAACFAVYAPPGPGRRENLAVRVGTPMLAGLAILAWIGRLAREMTGGGSLPDAGVIVRLCADTGFGRALSVAVLACASLALLAATAPRRRWGPVAVSAILLASLAMVGHAAAGVGASGALRQGMMVVHLLAGGAWLGGLPPLAAALRRDHPATPVLVETFGRIAFVAVTLLLGTGLASILYMAADAGGQLGPAYLRTLSAKLAIVAALLAIAAVNRFWLTPRRRRQERRALSGLRASVLVEQVFALGLVAAVAFLGQLDPSM